MKTNIQDMRSTYETLISRNLTTKQMGYELGCCSSKIKRDLKKLGLKTLHTKFINITKEQLLDLTNQDLSSYEMAEKLNTSQTNIRYWLKKFEIPSRSKWTLKNQKAKDDFNNGLKTCPKCKQTLSLDNYYSSKNRITHSWCRTCCDANSVQKQNSMKQTAVNYKGGKCSICGYSKYIGSLDFHHVDPTKKEFIISRLRSYCWEKIKIELDKCICVCKNCHCELHHNMRKLVAPADHDTAMVDYFIPT